MGDVMRMAVRVAALLLLTGVSFVGAAVGGGKAAWFVFGCVAGLLATGLVAGFALRGRIEVERTLPRHALPGGSTLRVEGWVKVPFRFPLAFVLLSDTWMNERTGRTVRGACLMVPMGRTRLRYVYDLPVLERGVYRLNQTETSAADFFDLAGFRRRLAAPSVAARSEFRVAEGQGQHQAETVFVVGPLAADLSEDPTDVLRREDPVSAGGVRPYAEGDPVGRVHWRSTMRQGRLMVVTADDGEEAVPHLLLDAGADEDAFERALGAAAACLYSLDGEDGPDGGMRTDLLLADQDGEPLSLAAHGREALLRRLALAEREELPASGSVRRWRGDACFIVAAGRMSDALAEQAERLAGAGSVLVLAATGFAPAEAEQRMAEQMVQAGIDVQFVRMKRPAFARDGRNASGMAGRTAGM